MLTDPASRAAWRQGIAAILATLGVGVFGLSQPFLAVIASQLMAVEVAASPGVVLRQASMLVAGALAGLCQLVLLPDQPWLALPLSGLLAGVGVVVAFRVSGGPGARAYLLALVGVSASGWIDPSGSGAGAMNHVGSLAIAMIAALAANGVFPSSSVARGSAATPVGLPVSAAIGVPLALLVGALFFPASVVPLCIAAVATLAGAYPAAGGRVYVLRCGGAVCGVLAATVFLIVLGGSGNDLLALLLGLGVVLGFFEWLAMRSPGRSPFYRQAAALFAVTAPAVTAPATVVNAALGRASAVIAGFAVALVVVIITTHSSRQTSSAD